MNLDNFSEKLRITVDAAFNYAKENSFNYFFPIHILIILLQDDNLISKTLKELNSFYDEKIKNFSEFYENIRKDFETLNFYEKINLPESFEFISIYRYVINRL